MAIELADLGLTQDELREMVVERLCKSVRRNDDEGFRDDMWTRVREESRKQVEAQVLAVFELHVQPKLVDIVENLDLQETTKWGEKKGVPLTFREYAAKRAEAWTTELVDWNGKPKGDDSHGWVGKSTRVAHMIHRHLHHEIEKVIKAALADANTKIAQGIYEACRVKLNEILASVKTTVTLPS